MTKLNWGLDLIIDLTNVNCIDVEYIRIYLSETNHTDMAEQINKGN